MFGMTTGETWRLGHRPALDGLRGIAIGLVMLDHAGVPPFDSAGVVGVAVFFTLSGFLITSLLLEERADTGRLSLTGFYLRRGRRLLPALFVFLAVMLAVAAVAGPEFGTPGETVAAVFYVANWHPALHGPTNDALGHLWSLSVEEQFYIAWPLVLLVIRRARVLLAVSVVGVFGSVGLSLALWDGGWTGALRVYYGTDTAAFGLLVGCAVAAALHLGYLPRPSLPVVGVAFAGLVEVSLMADSDLIGRFMVARLATPLLAAVVIGRVAHVRMPWLEVRWLVTLGQRSYGVYLWQGFVVVLIVPIAAPVAVTAVLFGGLSWLLACASWRYVETPFRRPGLGAVDRPVQLVELSLVDRGRSDDEVGDLHLPEL